MTQVRWRETAVRLVLVLSRGCRSEMWTYLQGKRDSPLARVIEPICAESNPATQHIENDIMKDHYHRQFASPGASDRLRLEHAARRRCHAWVVVNEVRSRMNRAHNTISEAIDRTSHHQLWE